MQKNLESLEKISKYFLDTLVFPIGSNFFGELQIVLYSYVWPDNENIKIYFTISD